MLVGADVSKTQVEAGRAAEAFAFMRLQQALPSFTLSNWRSGNRLHFYPHLGRAGLDDTLGCVREPRTVANVHAPAHGAVRFAPFSRRVHWLCTTCLTNSPLRFFVHVCSAAK